MKARLRRAFWAGFGRRTFALLFVLVTGSFSGCSRSPQKPAESAVAGTWVLQAKSSPSIVKRMGRAPKDSRIVFTADGRFTAVDLPMEDAFQNPKYRFFTGEGRWRLEQQNGWMLSLTVDHGGYPLFFADGGGFPKVVYTFRS